MILPNFPLCPQHSVGCLVWSFFSIALLELTPCSPCPVLYLGQVLPTSRINLLLSVSLSLLLYSLSQLLNIIPFVSFIQPTSRLLILKHSSDSVKLKLITSPGFILTETNTTPWYLRHSPVCFHHFIYSKVYFFISKFLSNLILFSRYILWAPVLGWYYSLL